MVWIPKVFLVDDDIDPTDPADVMWALATRTHPTGRRTVFEDQRIVRLSICYLEEEHVAGLGPKVVVDTLQADTGCGRPLHSSFEQAYPKELQRRVLESWPG
jgi:3-polyprenyl-4-hydroxybenzoate decarboxylase